jgi:outer membrane lipoprotein-sorting protein
MKKLMTFGLAIMLFVAAVSVNSPTTVNAQSAGLVSSLLNRMERNRQSLKSLRAAISMEKYNAQIRDTDRYQGVVLYVPAAGRNAYVRVDWDKPQHEVLAVANGKYVLFRPRLNMAYEGNARSNKNKVGGAFDFLRMSRQELTSRFEQPQDVSSETLWGGVRTTHLKLVPKAGAGYSFKYAEVWVDESGMPVQTKVVEQNDDHTVVRLTNLERNAGISLDQFNVQLDKNVKRVKA